MKILFLCRLYWPHVGGVEKHISGIIQEIKKYHEITIITEQYSPDIPRHEIISGIEIYRIPIFGYAEKSKKWVIWKWLFKNRNLLTNADIIHIHDVVFWIYPFWIFLNHNKIFATFHGWEGSFPLPLKNILQKRLDSRLVSGNICIGDYIPKWYGIKADYISYGAVAVPHITPKYVNHKSKIILFIGRLDKDTGFTTCLEYFSKLNPEKWKLWIIGDGPLRHLLPSSAKYWGLVTDSHQIIQKCDYVYTGGYLSILEAWANKKNVITSYNNPLKKDYLQLHPLSKYLIYDGKIPDSFPLEAYNWSTAQSWANLTQLYYQLWSKLAS